MSIERIECPADRSHRVRHKAGFVELRECRRLLMMSDSVNYIDGAYIVCPSCGSIIYIKQNDTDGIVLSVKDKSERIICKESVKVIE